VTQLIGASHKVGVMIIMASKLQPGKRIPLLKKRKQKKLQRLQGKQKKLQRLQGKPKKLQRSMLSKALVTGF